MQAYEFNAHGRASGRPPVAARAAAYPRLIQGCLALLEAFGAAPWEGLVRERRLCTALLAQACGRVVVDAALTERACKAHGTEQGCH